MQAIPVFWNILRSILEAHNNFSYLYKHQTEHIDKNFGFNKIYGRLHIFSSLAAATREGKFAQADTLGRVNILLKSALLMKSGTEFHIAFGPKLTNWPH